MPKLLQLNVTSNWGSTGKIVEAIANNAIERGWESWVAYGRMSNPSNSRTIKVGTAIDPYVHYVLNRVFDLEGRGSVMATCKLIKQIQDIKPDIIQLHNLHDHWLNYKILFEYLNKTDIKVVWTFHDCWAFTGHCTHFVFANCMKWQAECGECPQRNQFVDGSRETFLYKKKQFAGCKNLTVVACSHWMGNFVKESFLKEKRLEVIHNGVDLETFKPLTLINDREEKKFRIISVSNVWKSYKGLKDIFMLRKILSNEFEILVVGLSKKQIQTLPAGIIGVPRTQNVQELVNLYNTADVFLNPTYADTFPTVNLEALACGVPVITYRTGGSPEAIDENTGLAVEQGNIDNLAAAIKLLKKKPLYSVECRKRAEKNFNKNKNFQKYIQLYDELLKKN